MNTRVRRIALNCALFLLITVIALDALPAGTRLHKRIVNMLDPILDATGLWQGNWRLFAPNVDKINTKVSAQIVFADGFEQEWNSPDWSKLSIWQRFTHFRQMEYFDSIRLDKNRAAWNALANYIARNAASSRNSAVKTVTLWRHWAQIPPPETKTPAGPYLDFANEFQFHTWHP